MTREATGREASPSAGVIDSQSVKTTESGGPRGYDAGKKIKGRKRHILTDTEGNLVHAVIHTADIQDRDGAPLVLREIIHRFPWLRHVFADGGYAGDKLREALRRIGKWTVEIVKRSDVAKGFVVLPRRWVVERTLAWLNRNRRLAKEGAFAGGGGILRQARPDSRREILLVAAFYGRARKATAQFYPAMATHFEGVWPNAPILNEAERSEEHTSELQSLMRISYAVFCLKKKTKRRNKEIISNKERNRQISSKTGIKQNRKHLI